MQVMNMPVTMARSALTAGGAESELICARNFYSREECLFLLQTIGLLIIYGYCLVWRETPGKAIVVRVPVPLDSRPVIEAACKLRLAIAFVS